MVSLGMIKEKAYAKVNLHLQVLGRREDGYHDLQTIFACIDLYDVVNVEAVRGGKIEVEVVGKPAPSGYKNLAYKAARWYLDRFGIKGWGVKIFIDKRIPMERGLGGGSSDAAAALRAMVRFFGETDASFIEDAREIGADVPFFLKNTSFAFAEGVGERLFELKNVPSSFRDVSILLFIPDFGISTYEAYRNLPDNFSRVPLPKDEILEIFSTGDWRLIKDAFFNHLEESAFKLRPELEIIKGEIYRNGALYSLLSGSGSAVFGVFEEERRVGMDSEGILIWTRFVDI